MANGNVRYPLEGKRFWVLFAFSSTAAMQSMCWNILSPITDSLRAGYGEELVSDSFISWATNSANIAFLMAISTMAWIADNRGPRFVTLLSAGLLFVCCLLRCIPCEGSLFKVVSVVAMVFNGLSGAWLNFGGPILSEIWFATQERTTATAAMTVACYFGGALGFVVGPLVVGDFKPQNSIPVNSTSDATQPDARHAVERLYYLEAALTLGTFACVYVCFPDAPEEPPSEAAAAKRKRSVENPPSRGGGVKNDASKNLLESLEEEGGGGDTTPAELEFFEILLGGGPVETDQDHLRTRFWIVCICMGLPLGVYQAWTAVLFLNLSDFISSTKAAWLGCFMTLSGCVGSVAVGFILDRFVGRLKTAISGLMVAATISFGAFTMAVAGQLPLSHSQTVIVAYVTGIMGGFFFNCTTPLYFEIMMETVFGWASENAAGAVLILINTVVQILFLAVPTKIDGSAQWMNWLTCGLFVVCTGLVLAMKVEYRRSEVGHKRAAIAMDDCGYF